MQGRNELKRVAIRMVPEPPLYSDQPVTCPKDVVKVLGRELEDYDREVVCVVNFRGDATPINMNIVSMGTVNMSLASPREVFKSSILSNAANIMLLHNHPSGSTAPSKLDLDMTADLWSAAQIMGIPLLDHIILGRGGRYFSFRENGFLPSEEKGKDKVAGKTGSILAGIKEFQEKIKRQKREEPGKDAGDRGR